jgi:ankyrin repeat protein
MKRRLFVLAAAALVVSGRGARAQLDLNPLSGYYKNIPRAAKANDVRRIRELLTDGTSPNQTDEDNGTTGMHVSASNGNLQIMAILYKAGADVNARDPVGSTPLDIAAERGQVEAVKLLIDLKARVNDQNKNGMTALMFAAKNGNVEIVRALLDHGASANISDYTGRDALGWAQESRRQMVVPLLKNAPAAKR